MGRRTRKPDHEWLPPVPAAPLPGSRTDWVFEQLRDDILSGTLAPDASLVQSEIAERFGVSVTPVREALRRLESAGLVSYTLHAGASVTSIGDDALEELYLLRARVEGLAARLAATRWRGDDLAVAEETHRRMSTLDPSDARGLAEGSRDFHRALAEIGGPAYILGQINAIWERSPVDVSRTIWRDGELAKDVLTQHTLILEAVRARDADAAEALMAEHIEAAIAVRRGLRAG